MLRLNVSSVDLDLYRDDPVTVKYQYGDLQNIGTARSTFSQSFRVPLTDRNMDVFGIVNSLSAVPSFDPKVKMSATLYENSLELLSGFIQVKGFVMQGGNVMDIEVVFFGEALDLIKTVGDGKLRDLSLSAYDKTMDYATVTGTWSGDEDVRFAVIDRGQNWQGQTTFDVNNSMDLFEPTGMLRVQRLVDAIFTTAGLTYQSTFLDGQDDLYLMCNAGGQTNQFASLDVDNLFHVGRTSNYTVSQTFQQVLPFGTSGGFFDQGGHISGNQYTVPYTGNYTFKLRILCDTPPGSGVTTRFYLGINNGAQFQVVASIASSDMVAGQCFTIWIPTQTFTAGTILDIRTQKVGTGSSMVLGGTGNLSCPTTSWQLYSVQLAGAAWDCNLNMPDMKQIDFLLGLQKMFNMVFVPDRLNPNHYIIEPYPEYRLTSVTRDWTDKVAADKDTQMRPTTDLQKEVHRYDMALGEDFISQTVKRRANRIYGRYEVFDPENDFATGVGTVQVPFASWITSYIPSTDFPILRLLNDDGEALDRPVPRLAYWNGLQTLNPWYYGGTSQSTFPVFTELSDYGSAVTADTLDLNFGYERRYYDILANPRETLWYAYYRPQVAQLYSSDARIVTMFLTLTGEEVNTFRFSDVILIKNESYRILDLTYTANDDTAYTVLTLLRNVPTPRICAYIPQSFDKRGQVTFLTPTGGTLTTIPRACCVAFGHQWDAASTNCYGSQPLD